MRSRLPEFGDAAVVVVTFSGRERVAEYHRERLAPITTVADSDRTAYQSYGFSRATLWRAWGPRMWLVYAKLAARGRQLRRPVEDTLQLGGDVIVDRRGKIAYIFRSESPDDRPAVDDLLAEVDRC